MIRTIGHSTRSLEELVGILAGFGTTLLMDVRTIPRSRHNPQFNREALSTSSLLSDAGVSYVHEPALGGLRKPHPDSINTAWRNASFRGYADAMQTKEFQGHLDDLAERSLRDRIVLMCAEAVPWRCHRSLLADALTAREFEVRHILAAGRDQPHRLTPWARVENGLVTYPGLL